MPRFSSARNQYVRSSPGGDTASLYAANGAIPVADGTHAITKTSAAAMTLAAPSAGDDGLRMTVVSRTAFAHTLTIAGGLGGRGAAVDVATFANIGDSISLLADNGAWVCVGLYGVTLA